MKKKVSELTKDELNRAYLLAKGYRLIQAFEDTNERSWHDSNGEFLFWEGNEPDIASYPNLWWPIAEERRMAVSSVCTGEFGGIVHLGAWCAKDGYAKEPFVRVEAKTAGEAALRCYVTSVQGEEVEVP